MFETDPNEERRLGVLTALGLSLAAKRREAIAARAASGIEDIWLGDEEFYAGYDDANRHEFTQVASKPTVSGSSSEPTKRRKGSTVFPNITQPYVDAAAARVGDMLMPTDDRNFAIESSPIPDIGEFTPQIQGQQAVEIYQRVKKEATRRAEKAQTRIDDWLAECQYHAELRKVIDDAARLGTGVLKGPVPMNRQTKKWSQANGSAALEIIEEIKPGSRHVSPWHCYPDMSGGESIHDGSYFWEFDTLSGKKLDELRKIPGYIASQIDLCIDEGPKTPSVSQPNSTDAKSKNQYEVWYFYGDIAADEMISCGVDIEEGVESIPALMTMVNDHVIHAALNPLDDGAFPYDFIPWKRVQGMPWGHGVAREGRTAQRIVVAATRNLMDNAGLAGGPQFVLRRGIEPENGITEIVPFKIWIETADSDGQAGPPFLSVVIPMLQMELNNIIQMGMKMMEDITGLPQIMQGNQGRAPDTVGGMTILNNNANSVLRRFARLFDACITEPHMRRYYTWLMLYGENDEEKGDFQIIARGSSALIERDIQSQEMVNVLQLCLNPAFGKSPTRAMDEFLKSRRFDPAAFDYTDEEKQKMAQQQPAPPPQIAAAQIRAEADLQKEQMRTEVNMAEIKAEMDRDAVYVNAETQRTQAEHFSRMKELEMKLNLAQLEFAMQNKLSLDEVKAKLAMKVMDIRNTQDLAKMNARADQMPKPPVEPPGRAPAGRSFTL